MPRIPTVTFARLAPFIDMGCGMDRIIDRHEDSSRLLGDQARLLSLIESREPLPELLARLCTYVESLLIGLRCSILLTDPSLDVLVHGAAPSLSDEYVRAIDGLPIREGVGSCGTAAARRQLVMIDDVASSPLWRDFLEPARSEGIAACWSIPIIASGGELLGTCAMYYSEPRAPGQREIELMHFVGALAAIVINRQRELAQLAADEEHYRQLAEATPDAVIVHRNGQIIYRNAAAARLLGVDGDGSICPELADFTTDDPEDPRLHWSGVRTRRLRQPDGAAVTVDVAATRITMHGQPAILWVCRDVTHREVIEQAILDASNREQEHLGFELHDGLGQQLTGISLLLSALQRRVTPLLPDSTEEFEEVARLLKQSIDDSRRLAAGLSPVAVDREGLAGALRGLAVLTKDFHFLDCRLELGSVSHLSLDPTVATHLYRIAQEAVHNVIRHARARQVIIELSCRDSMLTMTISDDGVGISDNVAGSGGLGLRSMEYRARRIGTIVRVERRQPRGTQVRVTYTLGSQEHIPGARMSASRDADLAEAQKTSSGAGRGK